MKISSMAAGLAVSLFVTGSALAADPGDSFRGVPFYGGWYPDLSDTVHRGQRVRTSDLTKSNPLPPSDIYRPRPNRGAWHADLATFAWLEFIALNAPAGDYRGQPDGSFADSGCSRDSTLVWETYQHRSELFPFNDAGTPPISTPPQPWNNPPLYIFDVGGAAYNPADDPAIMSLGYTPYNNLDEVTQIGQNAIFLPGDDIAGQILFQAKINEVESDYFADNPLIETTPITLPTGVIEVKSAWVPLETIPESQRYRYHTSRAILYVGEDNDQDNVEAFTDVFALLGLHIIHKTPNYPAFIFATFEHEDLLRDPETRQPTDLYYIPTYDTIAYELPPSTMLSGIEGMPTVTNPTIRRFDVNNPVARPNGIPVRLPVGDVADIPGAEVDGAEVLVPVVQPPTTNLAVAWVNWQVHHAMKRIPCYDKSFIWQYYKLKGVQGVPTSNEKAKDYYLANIVIESSQPGIQLFRGGISQDATTGKLTNTRNQTNVVDAAQGGASFSVGGCQGCHGVAQTQAGFDFSFLLGARAGVGFSPDTVGTPSDTEIDDRIKDYAQP